MGQMIEFERPDGGRCRGYLASAGAGRPSVVVIQEWWGLNDQICGVADRFARAGYNALAPDLYQGRVTQKPDEANHLMTGLDFPGATHQDIRGAARHLGAQGSKVDIAAPPELLPRLILTAEMLERIRSTLDAPVIVTSGYRSPHPERDGLSRVRLNDVLGLLVEVRLYA